MFACTTLEETFELLRKEGADNKFAHESLKLLEANSPLSLKVIWEQVRRAKTQDLKEALKADFRTSQK